jgi:hypothetical protein
MKTLHAFENAALAVHETNSKVITADVVFGSPAKRCAGIGICKVNPHNALPADQALPCCQKVITQIQKCAPDQLEFSFSRQKICKKLISRQFVFSRFRIDDETLMPLWLSEQLSMPAVQLVKGAYPVFFTDEVILMRMRVKPVGAQTWYMAGSMEG